MNHQSLRRPDFWRGKRVLITGHTGFKGSWLTLWLERMGAEVIGYSLEPPSKPNLFDDARISKTIDSIRGDVRDLPTLVEVFKTRTPEIVFHMAAQALVRASYADPLETYSTNVMGTANVLEAIRVTKTARVAIVVTSDKCYENREWLWPYRENDSLGGHDPYSSSKACAELVVQAYRKSFFGQHGKSASCVRLASVRAGNVIGGGDWGRDRLVPDIIRAFVQGAPAFIRNPSAIRPWQHVLDPLHGYMMLAERLYEGRQDLTGAWNFGPNNVDSRPVSWIADRLVARWGRGASWTTAETVGPHEAMSLSLDSSKARTILSWASMFDIDQAVDWSYEWYRDYSQGGDPRRLTIDQITRYQDFLA